jgi:hypothetical protein
MKGKKINKKNIPLATKENAEKALEQLERKGYESLRSFIEYIDNAENYKTPLGISGDCLSLDMARQYVENISNYNMEKTSPSIINHINSCEFCSKLVGHIPEPKMTPGLWDKIKILIREQIKRPIVVHQKRINQYARNVCLGFFGNIKPSDIDPNSVLLDSQSEPIREVSIEDCDKDNKKELSVRVVLPKEDIGKKHLLTCTSRSGKLFSVPWNISD